MIENEDYAGLKINNARKKYGPKSFKYEVLYFDKKMNLIKNMKQ